MRFPSCISSSRRPPLLLLSLCLLLTCHSHVLALPEVRPCVPSSASKTTEILQVKRWNLVQQTRHRPWSLPSSPLVLVESADLESQGPQDEENSIAAASATIPQTVMGARDGTAVQSLAIKDEQQLLQQRQTSFVIMLGALCGTMDALFCHHYQCYANMMTGNTIKLATALAHGEFTQAALFAGMILSYMAGCSLWPLLQQQQARRAHHNEVTLSKRAKLRHIVPTTLGLFGLADVVSRLLHPNLFLPVLSMAFGLVNTATIDCIGVVTNAATGHVSKIGMGLVGYFACSSSNTNAIDRSSSSSSNNIKHSIPPQNVGYLVSFAGSIVLTTQLYEAWMRHPSAAAVWQRILPPMGLVLGCFYAAALLWFTSEPSKKDDPLQKTC